MLLKQTSTGLKSRAFSVVDDFLGALLK